MGVNGLQSVLERGNFLIKNVSLKDITDKYRNEHGKDPLVLIECRSLWGWIFQEWDLFDCSWELIRDRIAFIVSFFQNLGCTVEAYAAGRANDRFYFTKFLSKIKEFVWIYDGIKNNNFDRHLIRENGKFYMFNLFSRLIYKEFCKVHASTTESEVSLVAYAREKRVFAVLAQDTDFLVYDCAEYYFPINNINFATETVDLYDPTSFCESLNVNPEHFALFCSAMGNEIVPSPLANAKKVQIISKVLSKYKKNMLCEVMYRIRTIAYEMFQKNNITQLLVDSVARYTDTKTAEREVRAETTSHWSDIIKKSSEMVAEVKCLPVLDFLLKLRRMLNDILLEDYGDENLTDHAGVFRPMRCKLFSYAFYESEDRSPITEICPMGGPACQEIMVSLVTPKVDFPGLLNLWDEQRVDLDDTRWRILADIVSDKIDHRQLSELSEDYVIPALIVYYLRNEVPSTYADWEYVALLYHFKLERILKSDSEHSLFNIKALELFSAFMASYSVMVMAVITSGFPLELRKVVPMKHNGKKFNDVYVRLRETQMPVSMHFDEDMKKVVHFVGIEN